MPDLIPLHPDQLPALPPEVSERARELIEKSRAPATLKAYDARWRIFARWCREQGRSPLPAEPSTVAGWIAAVDCSVSTLQVTLSAIAAAHRAAGHESPTKHEAVRLVRQGYVRERGRAPVQKAPLLSEDLRRMVAGLPDTLIGKRDAAVLLLGFAGAFRRSELVALDIGDLEWKSEGLVVELRQSKTDQEGQGRRIGIAYGSDPLTCPVRRTRAWLEALAQEARRQPFPLTSALFHSLSGKVGGRLSGRAVAEVIKRRAEQAGLDPKTVSGHSLRAGFATQAAANGAPERAIARQTGHRNLQTLRRYIREGTLFRENASAKLGL